MGAIGGRELLLIGRGGGLTYRRNPQHLEKRWLFSCMAGILRKKENSPSKFSDHWRAIKRKSTLRKRLLFAVVALFLSHISSGLNIGFNIINFISFASYGLRNRVISLTLLSRLALHSLVFFFINFKALFFF